MVEVWAAFALALVPWAAYASVRLRRFLHILQLEEYFSAPYWRWLLANPDRYLPTQVPVAATSLLAAAAVLFAGLSTTGTAAVLLAWGAAGAVLYIQSLRSVRPAKKPLVMTPRAGRLLVVSGLLAVAAVTATALVFAGLSDREAGIAAGMLVTLAVCVLAGHLLLLANLAVYPFEAASRRRFEREASRRLGERRPRIIAITGSAGKTTTKELVAHLLAARFRVLKTPASFNTPMGISRTVNDHLSDQDYFVVEMGAYRKGEIEKLCKLVGGADISVITTVNAQHLERFGSVERTAEAKFEIVEGLRPGGRAVLNYDVPAVRQRAEAQRGLDILSFGTEPALNPDILGSDVVETPTGIEMDIGYRGEKVRLKTQLMARHNATNLLAAAGVGLSCGIDLGYMAAAVRHFRPPEHRLQPVRLANGVIQLDDAYNANPEGIIGALEVLASYTGRRRIVVTPGLVEMGREKLVYHARVGQVAAKTCDVAVLVGPKQTADIKESMIEAGFPPAQLHVVAGMDDAEEFLVENGTINDVVLFANSLPDQYDEALRI